MIFFGDAWRGNAERKNKHDRNLPWNKVGTFLFFWKRKHRKDQSSAGCQHVGWWQWGPEGPWLCASTHHHAGPGMGLNSWRRKDFLDSLPLSLLMASRVWCCHLSAWKVPTPWGSISPSNITPSEGKLGSWFRAPWVSSQNTPRDISQHLKLSNCRFWRRCTTILRKEESIYERKIWNHHEKFYILIFKDEPKRTKHRELL